MKLIQWNVRSLKSNVQHFKKFMAITNPEIIALQETRINNNNSNVLNWNIPHYNFYSNKRKFNLSGCGIYIKNTIIHREISLNTDIDCIAIEVINRNQTTTIVSIYLKPGIRIKSRKIQSLINQIKQPYILMGDFNSHNTVHSGGPITQTFEVKLSRRFYKTIQ